MTGPEMVIQWKNDFDVLASGAAPGFEDSEIYSMLNRAYDSLILNLYKAKDWTTLQALINDVSYTSSVSVSQGDSVFSYPLPGFSGDTNSPFWLYVDSYSTVTRSAIPNTGFIQSLASNSPMEISNMEVDITDFKDLTVTVFNPMTIFKNPYVNLNSNQLNVVVDSYTTLTGISFIYVRKFLPISATQSCELQESLHKTVVALAVEFARKAINIKEPQSQK